ncbi:hypothetical protein R3P38DRAFT_2568841 [Favolaschia claudopus]|uniref:BTB domain-containing protein n=1 Tax=Favolaschia claudopus TaxID=2862362 RepID=A0AAV9ZVF1_9AGAR
MTTSSTATTFPPPGLRQPGTNKSLRYFCEDASLFISVDNSDIVYGVWKTRLIQVATHFGVLAILPPPKDESNTNQEVRGDGSSFDCPLKVQATEEEFEAFLECIYFGESIALLKKRPANFWIKAYDMADLYHSELVMEMAKKHLAVCPDLHPANFLNLAMNWHIEEWIEPAFRALLRTPLSSLTSSQLRELGYSAYLHVAETKERISKHRALCALQAPPVVHHNACRGAEACTSAWKYAWWGEAEKRGAAAGFVHPNLIAIEKIMNGLANIVISWQMTSGCRKLTLESLFRTEIVLKEELFIREALNELKRM